MKKYFYAYCHNIQIKWYYAFAKYLKDVYNIQSVCIVQGIQDEKDACEEGYDFVFDILKGFEPDTASLRQAENREYLAKYDEVNKESSFFKDVLQDRWLLGKYDTDYILDFGTHIYKKLNGFFEEFPPLVALGEKNALPYRIIHHLTLQRNVKHYTLLGTKHFPDRFYFEPDIYWRWFKIRDIYKDYCDNGIPDDLRTIAEEKYDGIVRRHFNAEKSRIDRNRNSFVNKLRKGNLNRFSRMFSSIGKTKESNNPRTSLSSPTMMGRVKIAYAKDRAKSYFEANAKKNVDTSIKYGLYFLHMQPEYTIDGLGYGFTNQIELIQVIASSLPVDYLLYVKEHTISTGERDIEFYENLVSIPNVVLVSDTEDGHTLIKNSKIVISITGTIALEGIYHKIPAIMVGDIFHAGFKGIEIVRNIRDNLQPVIADMIKSPDKYITDDENSLCIIAAMYAASHPGQMDPLLIDSSEIPKSPNKDLIAKGLVNELKYEGYELG